MDETRIDAAPTPAHVFAYRAFRSVFVASPESSPIRAQPIATTSYYDNKENHHVSSYAFASSKALLASPSSNTKRKNAGKDALSLTPKRQKTIAVSPTKSILKNPNAPTPKRPGLRDMSVTFKDIRNSASPELALSQRLTTMSIKPASSQSTLRVMSEPTNAQTTKSTNENQSKLESLSHTSTNTKSDSKKNGNSTFSQSVEEQEHAAMVAEIVRNPAFDVNDYVVKTEKELRRFAAYGKKWKKHAQKQDHEVERLNSLLEEMQKENERLKRELDRRANGSSTYNIPVPKGTVISQALRDNTDSAPNSLQTSKPNDIESKKYHSTTFRTSPVLRDTSDCNMKTQKASTRDRAYRQEPDKVGEQHLSKINPSNSGTGKALPSTTATKQFEFKDPRTSLHIHKSPENREDKSDELLKTSSPRIFIANKHDATAAPTTATTAARTSGPIVSSCASLTLDRQAAARARIRQRNEERKASNNLRMKTSQVTGKGGNAAEKGSYSTPPVLSVPSMDESEVDWAALGH